MFLRPVVSARFIPVSTLLLAIYFTQSCGFQLRGAPEISQEVSPLYMQQNSAFELARELKLLLASNNIDVTNHPTKAKAQLVLINENKEQRVLSVDGNGRVREYLLTYIVNFSIRVDRVAGESSQEIPGTVSTSRTLLFDPEAVLAVTNESEILYEDMRRHVAHLILLKLEARVLDNSSSVDSEAINNASNKTESVAQPEMTER